MKKWKRRLAALMASLLLASLLPVTALAEETGGAQPGAIQVSDGLAPGTSDDSLDIQGLGVVIDGQRVAAVPVDQLPEEELSPEEEALLAATPAPMSLRPIEEHRNYWLDLSSFWPEQLKNVTLDVIRSNLSYGDSISASSDVKVMWAKSDHSYYRDIDDFTIMDADGTIDLTPEQVGKRYVYLHLIIGAADQFEATNRRYLIRVELADLSDFIKFEAATTDSTPLKMAYTNYYGYGKCFEVHVVDSGWKRGQGKLALKVNHLADGQTARIYAGSYETAEAAEQSGQDISASILDQSMPTGGYTADLSKSLYLTLVVKSGDEVVQVLPFAVRVYINSKDVYASGLYDNSRDDVWTSRSSRWDNDVRILRLDPGNSAGASYYLSLYFNNPDPTFEDGDLGINNVKAAYQGSYATEEAAKAAGADDIAGALFSYGSSQEKGGYQVCLKENVTFTVFGIDGVVYTLTVRAEETEETLPAAPTPLSEDTYFQIEGAYVDKVDETEWDDERYNAYVMPYMHDSYYYNGYQTVFLLKGFDPVAEGTSIYPRFYTGPKVTMHAGHAEVGERVSTDQQLSGQTAQTFHNGQPIQYSAAAENTTSLKNYWVTFLTQQENPTLFVNGVTNADAAHKDEDGTPIREVILDDVHDYHHDIFIANLGKTAMDDLTVTLSADAKNVKLDEYWTVKGTKSLEAFDSTERTTTAGELDNVAKIRLLPLTDEKGNILSGDISGTLTITGGGKTVTVKLTGRSGRFTITTDKLNGGVKYVHYSSVIQTSNMYESDAVRFTLAEGPLPAGLVLRSSGEIYGVPTAVGTWRIKVHAAYTYNGQEYTDEKEYTLTIADNTDANVWNATDEKYDLLQAIVNEDDTISLPGGHVTNAALAGGNSWSADSQLFWTKGEYDNFVVTEVKLDGQALTRGSDYTDAPGSTKITVRNQTLRSHGNGTHTISVEFREGDKTNGVLKRAAQNYTLTSLGITYSGGSSGGSSGRPSSKPGVKPVTPTTTKATFTDVPESHTFYNDVEWAYDNGLMKGVTEQLFVPTNAIAQATVVTVLARMANVDLSKYENDGTYKTIPADAWYANAAVWATQAGLLPNNTTFNSNGSISRADMAIMLVKYLTSLGIDTTVSMPVAFADASLMSKEANDAFQVLYQYGIFKGVGNMYMDPLGVTTRGQFSALIHRMNALIADYV